MKNTKKELALKELTEIENRQKELRRIIEEVEPVKNIMDRVKTFEDAIKLLSENDNDVLIYNSLKKIFPENNHVLLYQKLTIISKVLNEGWTPDYNNSNEYKYYPYFSVGSGFGFSYSLFVSSFTLFGSRLCFKSRELSDYAGRQFIEIYKEYLM